MKRHAVIALAVALVLAGCVGGQGVTTTTSPAPTGGDAADAGTTAGTTSDGTTIAGTDDDGGTDDGTNDGSADGTDDETTDGTALQFYLSDEKNAMDDFAHLNVTVTEVGLKRAGGDGNWTTYDVDERSIDLSRLRGANATRLGTFGVENGTYETVFVHVGEVNGTLKNGERVNVKLPSQKLQIHQQFSVGPNESVDYVFDISVFEAGKSGKYILKPVISESGTDKEIENVDEKRDGEGEKEDDEEDESEKGDENDEKGDDSETEDDSPALNATFVGNVTRGGNATVAVTRNGTAVANATVEVGGDVVGETHSDGTLTFSVSDREEELEVEIETEDGSVELKKEFEADESDDDQQGNGNGNGNDNGSGKDNSNGN